VIEAEFPCQTPNAPVDKTATVFLACQRLQAPNTHDHHNYPLRSPDTKHVAYSTARQTPVGCES